MRVPKSRFLSTRGPYIGIVCNVFVRGESRARTLHLRFFSAFVDLLSDCDFA
jgi:hypothetical protein